MNLITKLDDERLEEDRFVNNFSDEVYVLRGSLRAALQREANAIKESDESIIILKRMHMHEFKKRMQAESRAEAAEEKVKWYVDYVNSKDRDVCAEMERANKAEARVKELQGALTLQDICIDLLHKEER